jgi:hypothetical protein
VSSCLSWGSVQGVPWGSFFSILVIFIFRYSHTLHIRAFHVRYSTQSFYWECTVSVCIMTLYSVFILCVFPPHTFGGLYIWRAIYTWRAISIWRPIFVWRAPRSSKDWITLTLRPTASKMAQLIFRDQNYVSSAIHFVCVYTPCLYTRYT